MLTALSVARECHMVQENDKIILVQAFPPETDKTGAAIAAPHIDFVYTDQTADNTSSISKSFKVRNYEYDTQ